MSAIEHPFIETVFDGIDQYLANRDRRESFGLRASLRQARTAYATQPGFAADLQAWCLQQATDAYNA